MKIVSIHQSQYIPWAPYLKKIFLSDEFVVMDNVQFQKNGVQNRNKLRNIQGEYWLTLPVTQRLDETIADKQIIQMEKTLKKHWRSIEQSYSKAPYWKSYNQELYTLYHQSYNSLFELNQTLLMFIIQKLGIDTKITILSELDIKGAKSDLVLNICKKLNATHYLSGIGATNYIMEQDFVSSNVQICYLTSIAPIYTQFQGEFIAGMSIIDFMMNCSIEEVQNYFRSEKYDTAKI